MSAPAGGLPRLGVNQRVQHAVLGAAVCLALGTGLAGALGSASAGLARFHVGAGLAALAALAFHAAYVGVRAYVEGRGWSSFPLRWTGADTATARAELRHLFSGGTRPPGGEFRPTQKLLYWWTGAAVAIAGTTGIGLAYWEHVGSLGSLGTLAALHRGLALLLLAAVLWHVYGVLTWEGRWLPEWSWVTGALGEEKARLKLPGALRRHLAEEAGAAATPLGEEQRQRERQRLERQEVEAELEKGNRLALAERYVEALYHYRRALELFPGYSQARYNMARVLARMGEREAAREAYRLFLEAEPFHPLAQKAQEAIEELGRGGGAR